MPAGDPEMWQEVVDVLVGNSVNLMHSIGELIKDAQVAAVKSRTRRNRDGECCACEWGGRVRRGWDGPCR